jgi:large subunit ribosomal protein L25
MQELKIKATKREVLGKKSRFLRKQGITPAHLFGHSLESLPIQCDTNELIKVVSHAGTTRLVSLTLAGDKETKAVFVREIQKDFLGRELLHVDFFQVRKDEKLTMDIPIVLVGDAPAMKGKGRVMTHGLNMLSITSLPDKVPPQIEIDVTVLKELEDSIHVRDIKLGADIQIHNDPSQLVAKVSEIVVKAEEEVKPAAGAVEGEAAAEGAAPAEGAPAAEAGKAGAKAPESGKAAPAAGGKAPATGGKAPAAGAKAPAAGKAPEKK